MPRRCRGEAGVILAAAVVEPPLAGVAREGVEEDAVAEAADPLVRRVGAAAGLVRDRRVGRQHGAREVLDGARGVALLEEDLADRVEVAVVVAAGEEHDVVGARGVVLPERRTVAVTPAVGRASAGAIEHLRIAQVTNLTRALREAKESGYWVVGLDMDGPVLYSQADLRGPLLVVVGAEGSGLGRLVAETCDLLIRIPMEGPLDSLNAAVAGSLVLYEAYRQRQSSASSSS